jgi:hypothetical protein
MTRFFYREKGNGTGDEAWYLARDAATGALYVEHRWASSGNSGTDRIKIGDFLEGPYTTARNSLLRFVGGIIEEAPESPPRRPKQHLN